MASNPCFQSLTHIGEIPRLPVHLGQLYMESLEDILQSSTAVIGDVGFIYPFSVD